jgi:8-oxo-dGTP pyrophosphatase MutT (NUDIX family)
MNSKTMYCNNCGGRGHVFKTCKDPITSCGILFLREIFEPMKLPVNPSNVSVLMVRRKDSMAYMEFIRGKYDPTEPAYIKKLLENMTIDEQKLIETEQFDTLWANLWGHGRDTHSLEYDIAKTNYETIDKKKLISEARSVYTEPEWGFPKGRRTKGESDIECANREFWEETNIPADAYEIVDKLCFTEVFTGTNNIKYKHIYYVALLKDSKLFNLNQKLTNMQKREVSAVEWKTLKECKEITRPHYVERKSMITNLEREIQRFESM